MNETLQNFVLRELCPYGVWQLSDVVKSLLTYQISRLPKGEVSEDETRYPQSLTGMRAFLLKFFARHYFQTQNSLFNYMISRTYAAIEQSDRCIKSQRRINTTGLSK
jgi:hypothetical protein